MGDNYEDRIYRCDACYTEFQFSYGKFVCPGCNSLFWLDRKSYVYNDSYPEERGQRDELIMKLKAINLANWLQKVRHNVEGQNVLEIGFGCGATLRLLQEYGANVYGQEIVKQNRISAANLGIAANRISSTIEDFVSSRIVYDFFVYLDSFEHLKNPNEHIEKINTISRNGSKCLVVTPRSDSLSRFICGKFWPHNVDDHWVAYSRKGIKEMWFKHGWVLKKMFYPGKLINLNMILRHLAIMNGKKPVNITFPSIALRFNMGEMGMYFTRVE